MRVEDRNLNGATGLQPGRTQEPQPADSSGSVAEGQSSGTAGGDRAEISSLAGRISDALALHSAGRTQRIQKLAQDFKAGRYSADYRATSSAVISDAVERKDGAR
jgi:hypothetical protein